MGRKQVLTTLVGLGQLMIQSVEGRWDGRGSGDTEGLARLNHTAVHERDLLPTITDIIYYSSEAMTLEFGNTSTR